MKHFDIALYPGDGIGPEVIDASLQVLEAAERIVGGFHLNYQRFDWGMPYYDRLGRVAPEDFLTTLRNFDAIFLGAVGWPDSLPDSVTLVPLLSAPVLAWPLADGPLQTTNLSLNLACKRYYESAICMLYGLSNTYKTRGEFRGIWKARTYFDETPGSWE